jgi:hypothetical protein
LDLNKVAIKEHSLEVIIDEFIKLHADQNITLRFEFRSGKKLLLFSKALVDSDSSL